MANNPTADQSGAWYDLFFALFWIGTGIALMFTEDAKAFGGLVIGAWMGM